MAMLDFTEIPEPNGASGQQDSFELFAREVLAQIGFSVIQGPSRGADGGKDIIVEERRVGLVKSTTVRWLVSCKHFAFSGRSVRPDDERNIFERVAAANCGGFLGFYSTIPSAGLSEMLHRQTAIEIQLYDRDEIERYLLASPSSRSLIRRFFPISATKLEHEPPQLFSEIEPLKCECCGKDLLHPIGGIWVLWYASDKKNENKHGKHYVDIHFACKGECDLNVEEQVKARHVSSFGRIYDGWDDIPDMKIPTVFIKKVMALLNGFADGDRYEPDALEKMKHLLLSTFSLVSRQLSDGDHETLSRLMSIPSYLGGMGYDRNTLS